MIRRLLPDYIDKWWEWVKPCLENMEELLGQGGTEYLDNMHMDLSVGKSDIWMLFYPPVDEVPLDLRGFGVTYIIDESVANVRNLVIYALTIVEGKGMTAELLEQFDRILLRYGRDKGCTNIIAYIPNEKVRRAVAQLDLGYKQSTLFRKEIPNEQ